MMRDSGAVPATLGYRGYTHSSCISINHVVCHGIPGDRALKDGDILNIDVTPLLDGWHGDSSRMYVAGEAPVKAKRLIDVTYECLMLGLEPAKPGNHLVHISHALPSPPAQPRSSIVRDYCAPGAGRLFHHPPPLPPLP